MALIAAAALASNTRASNTAVSRTAASNKAAARQAAASLLASARLPDGASVVRIVPRPRTERIPAGTQKVEVYVDHADTGRGSRAGTISDPRDVARLLSTIDAFEIAQPGFTGCPFDGPGTPEIDLRFIGGGGTTLARAVENGCGGLTFYIRGRKQADGLGESVNLTTLLWGMHAFPVCARSQLAPSFDHAAARNALTEVFAATFALKNTRALCGLRAFATVTMLDSAGRTIPTHVTYSRPIGAPVLAFTGQRISYSLGWNSAAPACPDQPAAPELAARIPGIGSFRARTAHPIAPCDGKLTESSPY